MQIDRLLEIILLLLNKGHVTAKELSKQFGVSTRTIYRDIDTLSLAGIPVYSSKGKGGGIELLQEYTIDKSFLSEKEQKNIIFALQSLNAAQFPDIEMTLEKINQVFKNVSKTNWIEVDFSYWGSSKEEKDKFNILKEAVLTKRLIAFDYYNSYGAKTSRLIEPLKLIFKSKAWYVYGYCRLKQDYRIFRISRIRSLSLCDDFFEREMPEDFDIDSDQTKMSQIVLIKLKFSQEAFYRVYDDFDGDTCEYGDDNSLTVTIHLPFDEWIIGYILSFGSFVEVLEPDFVKDIIIKRAEEIIKKYVIRK